MVAKVFPPALGGMNVGMDKGGRWDTEESYGSREHYGLFGLDMYRAMAWHGMYILYLLLWDRSLFFGGVSRMMNELFEMQDFLEGWFA